VVILTSRHLAPAHHGFTQRVGPEGRLLDFGTALDLGDGPPWALLAAAVGMPEAPVARCRQVHGATVLEVCEGGDAGEADALITRRPGLLLAVRTADCLPVLVATPSAVAVIHAGWRGVAAGVIPATLALLPRPAHAVIGPSICGACYEVGREVVAGVAASGPPPEVFVRRGRGGRPHVDLLAAGAWQIQKADVEVSLCAPCTYENVQLHSYRRDGARAGRLAAVIGLPARG